jgi:hypothetical protein
MAYGVFYGESRWQPTDSTNRGALKFTSMLRMPSSRMLRRVVLVRTDFSEDLSASIVRVTRIGEMGTTLAVTSISSELCVGC